MHHVIGALLIGAAAGGVSGNRSRLRPVVRGLVKSGIVAKRKIQAVGTTAIAETQKLVDEARADLDRAETHPEQHPAVRRPRKRREETKN
jgi:molybdenum-dependent DNA-binding transcriptional regulator ModE